MRAHRLYLSASVFAIFLFLVSYGIRERTHIPRYDRYLDRKVVMEGIVIEEPEEKSFYTEVIMEVSGAKHVQKILVQAPFYPDFSYGDRISVEGKLKKPKDFATESGRTFPYVKFLAKDDIYYILSSPTVTLLETRKGNPLKHILFDIKGSVIAHISTILPRPESLLLSGMLIAGKGGLGSELEDDFKQVGLIHIVVLSGSNVTIISEAFIRMLWFLPRAYAYGTGAIGIVLFAIMAGGGSTIIRASFMSITALYAKLVGETYSALKALIFGGVIMVLLNPYTLFYDPSFHLSFLATFAVIVFSPRVQRLFRSFGRTVMGEIISTTLAVEIFLIPYFLWMNGYFSLISFPANLLVLPFVPFTMLAGFIAAVSSYVSLSFSYIPSLAAFIMLRYVMRIVEIAMRFT